jgi:predicted MFS family arabinose efflux permease
VVLLTSLGAVVSAGLLAAQAVAGIGSAVLVLVLVAAQTSCTALGSASRRAFVPRLLPQEQVAAGVALDHVAFQVAMLAGPAVAGVVLARWGLGWAYTVDAVTILLSLYGVVRLPSMRPEGGAVRAGLRATGEGLAFLWRRPALRGVLATDLAATVLAIPIALFPMINQERFGGDPQTLGLFLTAVAVGGTASGLLSGAVTGAARPGAVMLGSVGVWGLALAGFGLVDGHTATLACLAVAGAADTVSVISRGTLVQLGTPDGFRGRISSVEYAVGAGGPGLGDARAGLVASLVSASASAVSGGLACVLAVAVIAGTHPALRRWRRPEPAGDEA